MVSVFRLESAVFRLNLPAHGKSRKLSTIFNENKNDENNKEISVQESKDITKCYCQ